MGDGQTINGRAKAIVAVSAIFSIFAVLAVVGRFVARRSKAGKFFADDWIIVAGLIVTLGVTINNIVGVAVAGIAEDEYYRTDGAAAGFPYPRELAPQGKVMFALQILHTCAMPMIKASVLAFYSRLFPTRGFRIAVVCVSVYVALWFVGILFATIFQCNPISDNWGTEPDQLGGCLPNIIYMYQTAAVTNTASDVAILLLPIPVIGRLQLSRGTKTAVLGIFMTGAIVVVAGVGRTVSYFKLQYIPDYNFSYHYYALTIWTSLEPCLGVIGACLPTLRPLFAGISPESVLGSIRSVLSLRSLRSPLQTTHQPEPGDQDDKVHFASQSSILSGSKGFERLGETGEGSTENTIEGGGFELGRLEEGHKGIKVERRISIEGRGVV